MRFVRLRRMKRIAEAAAAQLATRPAADEPITAEEMVRLLSRIARTGPPAARLRAVELLGARMRLFQEAPGAGAHGSRHAPERIQAARYEQSTEERRHATALAFSRSRNG